MESLYDARLAEAVEAPRRWQSPLTLGRNVVEVKDRIARLALFVAGVVSAAGCGSGDCPTRTVVLDGGIDGLPETGAYGTKDVCLAICGVPGQRCRREKENLFKCIPTCE
jgi:hypothetical protein